MDAVFLNQCTKPFLFLIPSADAPQSGLFLKIKTQCSGTRDVLFEMYSYGRVSVARTRAAFCPPAAKSAISHYGHVELHIELHIGPDCVPMHISAPHPNQHRVSGEKCPAPARETVVHNLTLSRSDTEIAVF
jgi:hypothetical protein